MSARRTGILGAAALIAGIGVHLARALVPPSELASRGVPAVGQVLFKDSRPDAEGRFVYVVTFVYQGPERKNYQVTRVVPDKAVWDRLQTGAEVKVRYLPGRPEEASIIGAEGLVRRGDAAYSFLGWSLMLAGACLLFLAFRKANLAVEQGPPSGAAAGGRR